MKLKKYQYQWSIFGTEQICISSRTMSWQSEGDDDNLDYFYYGFEHPEQPELTLWSALTQKASTIIDIGAHTGIYTLLSAKSNPQAQIIAFEPNPSNRRRLRDNLESNKIHNVQIEEFALGLHAGPTPFHIPENEKIIDTSSLSKAFSTGTYHGQIDWKEIVVQQTSLDHFCARHNLSVQLLKIDVEGCEIDVFKGAENVLNKDRPVVLCEIFLNDDNKIFFETFLKNCHYYAYLVLKEGLVKLDQQLIANHNGLNYLFAPHKTQQVFTSFQIMDQLVQELTNYRKDKR